MQAEPIFIVGAERSGSTLFRLMLDHHPAIAVCPEFEYVVDPLVGLDQWPDLEQVTRALKSNWIFQEQNLRIDETLSYPDLARFFLDQVRQRRGADIVAAVVHRHFDQLDRIWPKARYLHIVRDPRDVARSVVAMGWAGNVWHGSARWVQVERTWDRMRRSLQADRFTEVKQEQLIADPRAVLTRVCDFIGTAFTESMLSYPAHTTYGAPDPALIGQWQTKLSPRQVSLVEAAAGNMLATRGYEPSGRPAPRPSAPRRAALRIHDKLKRIQFRLRQLGLGLLLADFVTRKFPIRPWREAVDGHLRAVWKQNLR